MVQPYSARIRPPTTIDEQHGNGGGQPSTNEESRDSQQPSSKGNIFGETFVRNTRRRTGEGQQGREADVAEGNGQDDMFEADTGEVEREFRRKESDARVADALAEEYRTYISDEGEDDQREAEAAEEGEDDFPQCEPCDQEDSEARAVRCPGSPTREQVAHHNLTHWPHRSWCPVCVCEGKVQGGQAHER